MANEKDDLKEKYLTLHLGSEKYGIPVLRTREIVKAQDFTIHEIPNFPACHKGVIELRDKIFSIIDLKIAFGMGNVDVNNETSIVIVQIQNPDQTTVQIGLLVDHVDEVMDFLDSEIESSSSLAQSKADHVIGFGKKKTGSHTELVMFLDINKALAGI